MKRSVEANEHSPQLCILMVAERLFGQIGYDKTTVSDIARELGMSPTNVYRFFSAKAQINDAVARRLLAAMEADADIFVEQPGLARERLRALLGAIETANEGRFVSNRKLHRLLEAAFSENWRAARDHVEKVIDRLCEIISQGVRNGEFAVDDCQLAAILVHDACLRFWHPRLIMERSEGSGPTLDQMVDFCLAALAQSASATKPKACEGAARPEWTVAASALGAAQAR